MVSAIENRGRIHPHKFVLWIAMASIVMLFAGLTSAYLVKHSFANWMTFPLPKIFWVSTFVILCSSVTMHLSVISFKARERKRYRILITITAFLGVAFAVLQLFGFFQLEDKGIKIFGTGSNPSASFLGVITGLHVVHVLGGVMALLFQFFRAYKKRVKRYDATPIEITAIYWHFVDLLWIYLFIFFSLTR
ncbi:MAG: cytochrome c oxidase subunit 3 [Arachidicoccus sp.]|nr:cytochrome c oxidase subunit 3 [Arachidicoccus sp.]